MGLRDLQVDLQQRKGRVIVGFESGNGWAEGEVGVVMEKKDRGTSCETRYLSSISFGAVYTCASHLRFFPRTCNV
jgi:hypothetical protein